MHFKRTAEDMLRRDESFMLNTVGVALASSDPRRLKYIAENITQFISLHKRYVGLC